jgi:hypothetical protein
MALFLQIPNPSVKVPTQQATNVVLFPPDILCDYETGDFVTDASGDIVWASGLRSWQQCWVNRLIVQQSAHCIYPRSLGINHERLMRLPTRQRVEAEYTGRVKAQAQRDRATREVRRINYQWQYDTCHMYMQFVSVAGDSAPLSVSLR